MRAFLIMLMMTSSLGASSWHSRRAEGWVWNEDPSEKEEEVMEERRPQSNTEVVEDLHRELKERLNTALLYPTRENVEAYIRLQNQQMDRSSEFASVWKKVILETPDLDYTQEMPVSQYAKQVYNSEKEREKDALISKLSKTYGLFFFYQASCKYSVAFSGVVKEFSRRHKWEVVAISLDGGALKEFPDFQVDNGASEAFGIAGVPALFAVDPKSGTAIPLSYGAVSLDVIRNNVLLQFGGASDEI